MSKFSPFYIYTQSLDNTSQDLMYEISQDSTIKAEQITDLPTAQSIMQDINDVATDINLKNLLANNKIIEKIKQHSPISEKTLPVIFIKKNQVVIKLKTKDVDNLNRHSPILIFFTLPHDKNYKGCVEYISNGLVEFCKITDRHPNNEILKFIEFLPLDDLISSGGNFFSKKTTNMAIVALIATIVLIILKNCISPTPNSTQEIDSSTQEIDSSRANYNSPLSPEK